MKKTSLFIILALGFVVGALAESASAGDSCAERVQHLNRKQMDIRIANIKSVEIVKEMTNSEYEVFSPVKRGPSTRFGRFYKANLKLSTGERKMVGVWTIPYADGKACVVRDVVSL